MELRSGECKYPEICKLFCADSRKGLIKYLKFDEECFGTERFYDEYFRVQAELDHLYNDLKWSTGMLTDYYHHYDTCNFIKIIKKFIKRRTFKEANFVAWSEGRLEIAKTVTYPYKSGWHTTWNGKEVFFRSSYEEDFCKELDEAKIDYDVESQRIVYFDSVDNRERIAVPDFELIDSHTLVEVKSSWTLDKQNMKDKFEAYIALRMECYSTL